MREPPPPLDIDALEAEFYARPEHDHLRSLRTMHDEAQLLLYRTLKELRAFVMAKDDDVRFSPCRNGCRPLFSINYIFTVLIFIFVCRLSLCRSLRTSCGQSRSREAGAPP